MSSSKKRSQSEKSSGNGIQVVLGTMAIGGQCDRAQSISLLSTYFDKLHESELDSALVYPVWGDNSEGNTERMLGDLLSSDLKKHQHVFCATKANPWRAGGLSPTSLREQVELSLKNLRTDKLDLLYLHAPDVTVSMDDDVLPVLDELHQAGKFDKFGLSNFPAWQVAHLWHLMRERGYKWTISVYQAMYNGMTRVIERDLVPCLRHLGIKLYVYNATCGGILARPTLELSPEKPPEDGRFKLLDKMYQARYWTKPYLHGAKLVRDACDREGIAYTDAAHRWLVHHSVLSAECGDAVIVGASKASHLEPNVQAVRDGKPLPKSVVDAFDKAWDGIKGSCPSYFRP